MSAEIEAVDRLGEQPLAGPTGRATLPVELLLDTVAVPGAPGGPPPSLSRDIAILSPGDVAGIKADAILRTDPADGALSATPGELRVRRVLRGGLPLALHAGSRRRRDRG